MTFFFVLGACMQIPADMVVNSMIAAMVAHANEQAPCEVIYQVGSSLANPLRFSCIQDYGQRYFTKHPWVGKDGKPVRVGEVTVLNSMASFRRYMAIHYLLPLKVFSLSDLNHNSFLCSGICHSLSTFYSLFLHPKNI